MDEEILDYNEQKEGWVSKVVDWQKKHISDRQMTLILAFIIGLLASVAGYFLHGIVHEIQLLLTSGFNKGTYNLLFLLFPIVGIYLTMLFIKYVVRDNISHGITRVLYAISTKNSKLKAHNCWSSVVASGITIGFGGSVGAEAPIVLTGSAIGSNLGQIFRMDKKTMILLVGCGASAAIAGIFKAPIAGLVFTLEVLMVDLSMASLLPILISCVTATCFTYILMGSKSLFDFTLTNPWALDRVPACLLLGIFCGLVSLYFMRTMSACEGFFAKLSPYPYVKLLFGGLILSSLIFLFPSLYGEGYSAVNVLLKGQNVEDWGQVMSRSLFYGHNQLLILYIALVTFTKVFATSATNGSGGCGGTFAPSLIIGGFAGFLFARLWNVNQVGVYVPEQNFTLMGMAGLITGVMHAPLTGIFLIAELTGGYQLFMPLMIVCISAEVAPVFFGSALNNFGVQELLDCFVHIAPSPRPTQAEERLVKPEEPKFSGFIFKITANIDPNHRSCIAFCKICSGKFVRNQPYYHVRLDKNVRFSSPTQFMAQRKSTIDEAYPGDIVGLPDNGIFKIGDTLTEGEKMHFRGLPSFSPLLFKYIENDDPMKSKQFQKGLEQLMNEGVAQLFVNQFNGRRIVGTVGQLQFEVIQYRLENEYNAKCRWEPVHLHKACWIEADDEKELENFKKRKYQYMAKDIEGRDVFLADSGYVLSMAQQDFEHIKFHFTSEF